MEKDHRFENKRTKKALHQWKSSYCKLAQLIKKEILNAHCSQDFNEKSGLAS